MQIQQLINLILERTPKFTKEFTDTLEFQSYSFQDDVLTIESQNHGLKDKDYISLSFARTLELQRVSDYIYNIIDNFPQAIDNLTLKIDNTDYFFSEGLDYQIQEYQGARRIRFKEPITKEIQSCQVGDYQYLSVVKFLTKIDDNNISIKYDKLMVDIEKYELIDIQIKPRVFVISNDEAIKELATRQGFKSTMFVFPPIARASKSYNTTSELNTENTLNAGFLIQRIEEVEILIIKPVDTKLLLKNYSSAREIDFLQNFILLNLIKAISNYNFNDSTIPLSYVNDTIVNSTKSHIEYSIVFETMTNLNEKSVASSEIAYYNNISLNQEVN